VNGPYDFEKHLTSLQTAVKIFGPYNVTTHLIIGLGESEKEAVDFMFKMKKKGVNVGLFAFTPLKGTNLQELKPPLKEAYRRLQLARCLIFNENTSINQFIFDEEGRIKNILIPVEKINRIIVSGIPFLTSGCPGCNRPYYNERVSGPIYNYPSIELVKKDIQKIKIELEGLIK
jgi:biotin synthase